MVFAFLFLSILLPLADLGVFGFQYISAFGALRNAGQYMQFNKPPDVTQWSSWVSSLPSAVTKNGSYTISNITVYCGDAGSTCGTGNAASPKYYSFTTSFTLSPIVLRSVLCSNPSCSFTLGYSERFQ